MLLEKEKLLVTSNFSLSCSLFKRLVLQTRKKSELVWERVNSLPNNKILNLSKLKAFADNKINVTEKLKLLLEMVENIMKKGENAGYQHFLLFPQCFQKDPYTGSL